MENNVKIAVDTGASGTKVVCSVNGDDPYAFLISPYITKIDEPKKLIRDVEFDKDNLWVKMGKDYYAVGSLAERHGASQLIKPQKFITAPAKICAAIGLAMQTLEISSEFALSLSCVLPPAELGDAEIVIKDVISAVKNLEYPSGKAKINLTRFKIYPEGYGILNAQGLNLKNYDSIVTIMMGYRNISMFETKRGYPERPYTDLIGFYDYLYDIASETSVNLEDLIEPVCAGVNHLFDEDINYYKREIEIFHLDINDLQIEDSMRKEKINKLETKKELSKDETGDLNFLIGREEEIKKQIDFLKKYLCKAEQDLKAAMESRKSKKRFHHLINCEGKNLDYTAAKFEKIEKEKYKKYVKQIQDWISERLPVRPQIICVAGGTAKYLGNDIYSFLAQKGEVRKGIFIPFEFHEDSEIDSPSPYPGGIIYDPFTAELMGVQRNQYRHPLNEREKKIVSQRERFEDIYGLFSTIEN